MVVLPYWSLLDRREINHAHSGCYGLEVVIIYKPLIGLVTGMTRKETRTRGGCDPSISSIKSCFGQAFLVLSHIDNDVFLTP